MPANAAGDVFDKIDADGNKKIDKKEYMDTVSKSFDKLDKNGDSYLDREELRQQTSQSDELFDDLDTDKDGRISKDEFVKGAEKHLSVPVGYRLEKHFTEGPAYGTKKTVDPTGFYKTARSEPAHPIDVRR